VQLTPEAAAAQAEDGPIMPKGTAVPKANLGGGAGRDRDRQHAEDEGERGSPHADLSRLDHRLPTIAPGVSPKRARHKRLQCEMSEKPASSATSQIRRVGTSRRSAKACRSRSSVTRGEGFRGLGQALRSREPPAVAIGCS
jgi:hypothetical protein